MREVVRRLLLLLCVFAFIGGTTTGIVMQPAAAGESCAGHQTDGKTDHHHGMKNGHCLTCCVGACVAIPDFLAHSVSSVAPLWLGTVTYPVYDTSISGRSVAPDLDPPKLSV